MTHLDVQGCTEKICNVWPEDVKDVDSILDICFDHDGMCWWDIFSMFIKHSHFCWACKLEVIMATESKKLKIDDTTSVTGYIHSVSVVKMSALKKNKYFNAVIQDSAAIVGISSWYGSVWKDIHILQFEYKRVPL